jgi:hypothetical protein
LSAAYGRKDPAGLGNGNHVTNLPVVTPARAQHIHMHVHIDVHTGIRPVQHRTVLLRYTL